MNLLIWLTRMTLVFFVALVLTCGGLGLPTTAFGATNVIYSFAGDEDGEYADTDLAIDKAGNLYGTTVLGGISAVAPYSSCLLQVTVGFIPFSIALPAEKMEASHTKVLPWMLRVICMARLLPVGPVVARVGAG
jgi:hypothetical protein